MTRTDRGHRDREFLPPTDKQLASARRLGIEHRITADMSQRDVSRMLDTWRDVDGIRAKAWSDQSLANRVRVLKQKIADGFAIGARVAYRGDRPGTIINFHHDTGSVMVMWDRGERDGHVASVNPLSLTLLERPTASDPDAWAPAGYVSVLPAIAVRIARGEFGEDARAALRARDSFFRKETRYFLPREMRPEVHRRIVEYARSETERKAQAEAGRDWKYCIQCGTPMRRLPEVPRADWAHRRRCDPCAAKKTFTPNIFCSRCGKPFTQESRSNHACPSCRNA